MSWFARFTAPWRLSAQIAEVNNALDSTADALMRIERAVDTDLPARITTALEAHMADVSPLLNKLAEDLRAWTAGPYAALLARNADLEAREAARGEQDAAELANESSAGANATSALNELIAPVTESPDVPVEIPPVDVPADPEAPVEPAPAEPVADEDDQPNPAA